MAIFRHQEEAYEPGQYVRHRDARPDNGLDPVVEIVEDLGTIESPCGKVDCRGNCLEYMVQAARDHARQGERRAESYNLAECKLDPLVSIL